MKQLWSQYSVVTILGVILLLVTIVTSCGDTHYLPSNVTSGLISVGSGRDYPYQDNSHCRWIIQAPEPSLYINLKFLTFDTECLYDVLHVYSGIDQSSNGTLLGSFSGDVTPNPLYALGGQMTLLFHADLNTHAAGFTARYDISNCPLNCQERGVCNQTSSVCVCESGYAGESCELEVCEESAGAPFECHINGSCSIADDKEANACECQSSYYGAQCDIPVMSVSTSKWYKLSGSFRGPEGRFGLSLTHAESDNVLIAYGGRTADGQASSDVLIYNLTSNLWVNYSYAQNDISELWPNPRYNHKALSVNNVTYVLGGSSSDGSPLNDFWSVSHNDVIVGGNWNRLNDTPYALTEHTLTSDGVSKLYAVGGRLSDGSLSSKVLLYDVDHNDDGWKVLEAEYGGEESVARAGHTAVYRKKTHSIYVFGGHAESGGRTGSLYVFSLRTHIWTRLVYTSLVGATPPALSMHTADAVGDYMVVFGGQTSGSASLDCVSREVYAYSWACHTWVSVQNLQTAVGGDVSQLDRTSARFSHASIVLFGQHLVVVGGFRGSYLSDSWVFVLPPGLVAQNEVGSLVGIPALCAGYSTETQCGYDPSCKWCLEADPNCIDRTNSTVCVDLGLEKCPGPCELLSTCIECSTFDLQEDFSPSASHACQWCAKDRTCQAVSDPKGPCKSASDTPSGLEGWWGGMSESVTNVSQCHMYAPAGLTWSIYADPPDLVQPDGVIRSNLMTLNWAKIAVLSGLNSSLPYAVETSGLLFTLGRHSGMSLIYRNNKFVVSLTINSTEVEIARVNSSSTSGVQTISFNGQTEILTEEDSPYSFNIISSKETGLLAVASAAEMVWSQGFDLITYEFLAPPMEANCTEFTNCLRCTAESVCGWQESSNRCLPASFEIGSSLRDSHPYTDAPWLLTDPRECVSCRNFTKCSECTGYDVCKWVGSRSACVRRGRQDLEGIESAVDCPATCAEITNCSQCLGDHTDCGWCFTTGRCFPFQEYSLHYPYGQCLDWTENFGEQNSSVTDAKCSPCSQHTSCSNCLGDYNCGWCGNQNNPTVGICNPGDVNGPLGGANCSSVVESAHDVSEAADWSYHSCPDVEECRLGLDDCHVNATCSNTAGSFECACNRGFKGDGIVCNETCYHECFTGTCSEAPPLFECDCSLGWYGQSCDQDCGCYNHSVCDVSGPGTCDACVAGYSGSNCQNCVAGYHGNATAYEGCSPCNCNGHADEGLGQCDMITGQCYCTDNTRGDNCELCVDDYTGDPHNRGMCYQICSSRMSIVNVTGTGHLAFDSTEQSEDGFCLFSISTTSDLYTGSVNDSLFVKINSIEANCLQEFLYIWDNEMPSGIGQSEPMKGYTAAVCSAFPASSQESEFLLTSGRMTLFFSGNRSTGTGFNLTYQALTCPGACPGPNRECSLSDVCVCTSEFTGPACDQPICPNNCSSHGVCINNICSCEPMYGGANCSVLHPHLFIASEIFTSHAPNTDLKLNRTGHTAVSCDNGDAYYVFGGLSEGRLLDDVILFRMNISELDAVSVISGNAPSARYYHAAVCDAGRNMMYVYGGLTGEGRRQDVNDLWEFNLDTRIWRQLGMDFTVTGPRSVAGHTMSLVGDKLVIIGGFSTTSYFNDLVFTFDLSTSTCVHKLATGATMAGIFFHSAVLFPEKSAIYVFGGVRYDVDLVKISNALYALDVSSETYFWTLVPSKFSAPPVQQRYLHSATVVNDYMVITGGMKGYPSYEPSIVVYSPACDDWFDLTDQESSLSILVAGHGAVLYSGNIYLLSGKRPTSSSVSSEVTRITMTSDLCSLYTTESSCIQKAGCSFCEGDSGADPVCFPAYLHPAPTQCGELQVRRKDSSRICTASVTLAKQCHEYVTCGECVSTDLYYRTGAPPCKWCKGCSNYPQCIPYSTSCPAAPPPCATVELSGSCSEDYCHAADCNKCDGLTERCVWTRQITRTGELSVSLRSEPYYPWACIIDVGLPVWTAPPNDCPRPCNEITACDQCVVSDGADGGTYSCRWSTALSQCLSPVAVTIQCSLGECGRLLQSEGACPAPCSNQTQCSNCQTQGHCGWCKADNSNGLGVCLDGTHINQTPTSCSAIDFNAYGFTSSGSPYTSQWVSMSCPEEDECLNGHHNCQENEGCTDTVDGFLCECMESYERRDSSCVPICTQGCSHGECTRPDVCECDFGYVGPSCNVACDCNGHSNCLSETDTDTCLNCTEGTTGPQCEWCSAGFVGDANNGGNCTPCLTVCYQHTNSCVTADEYAIIENDTSRGYNLSWIERGPLNVDSARCLFCADNTVGLRCENCMDSYFRIDYEDSTQNCIGCQCNGHGDTCNIDGSGCECKNNTMSPPCTDVDVIPCYQRQCSLCNELYVGSPKEGKQCYRRTSMDREYCLMPGAAAECPDGIASLAPGQTSYFHVRPSYVNVNIHITVEVKQGAVDAYLVRDEELLTIYYDPLTNTQLISVSPSAAQRRKKRSSEISPVVHRSSGVITYIHVTEDPIMKIENIDFRTVIRIVHTEIDLAGDHFYLVLVGRGNSDYNDTRGYLYVRQDQDQIDVFIFFSVFLSAFLSFVTLCFLVHKCKTEVENRGVIFQRRIELNEMSRRPFADLLIDFGDDGTVSAVGLHGEKNNSDTEEAILQPLQVNPVCLEPTDDGVAYVVTNMMTLPGGDDVTQRHTLAVSLVTLRVKHLDLKNREASADRNRSTNVRPPSTPFQEGDEEAPL